MNCIPLKVTMLGHACQLIESEHVSILCDPHLGEGFSSGLFSYFPNRRLNSEKLPMPDIIYISHRHRDHYDLPSLFRLDKSLPVICADDIEIIYGLGKLGFIDINPIVDWEEIRIKELTLIFTPSLYRVPEHGLLVLSEDAVIWNMVDTLVDYEMLLTLDSRIGKRPVDLLFWPYQPLVETDASANRPFAVPISRFSKKVEVIKHLQPKIVVPYSDGQFGIGPGAWLNKYKFPITYENSVAVIKSVSPDSSIESPDPGKTIEISKTNWDASQTVSYVAMGPSPSRDKFFDTTQPIPDLFDIELPDNLLFTSSFELLEIKIRKAWLDLQANQLLRPYMNSAQEWNATYRVVLIHNKTIFTINLSPATNSDVKNDLHSQSHANYLQVRLHAGVLQALFEARIHFVSALLSGFFRSNEVVYRVTQEGVQIPAILRDGSKEKPGQTDVLLCPVKILNYILATDSDLAQKVLDHEIQESLCQSNQ